MGDTPVYRRGHTVATPALLAGGVGDGGCARELSLSQSGRGLPGHFRRNARGHLEGDPRASGRAAVSTSHAPPQLLQPLAHVPQPIRPRPGRARLESAPVVFEDDPQDARLDGDARPGGGRPPRG